MKRGSRSRIRGALKGSGCAVCAVILTAFLFSHLWCLALHGEGWHLSLGGGCIYWTSGILSPEGPGVTLIGYAALEEHPHRTDAALLHGHGAGATGPLVSRVRSGRDRC